jgi:hypothetical protein
MHWQVVEQACGQQGDGGSSNTSDQAVARGHGCAALPAAGAEPARLQQGGACPGARRSRPAVARRGLAARAQECRSRAVPAICWSHRRGAGEQGWRAGLAALRTRCGRNVAQPLSLCHMRQPRRWQLRTPSRGASSASCSGCRSRAAPRRVPAAAGWPPQCPCQRCLARRRRCAQPPRCQQPTDRSQTRRACCRRATRRVMRPWGGTAMQRRSSCRWPRALLQAGQRKKTGGRAGPRVGSGQAWQRCLARSCC